MHLMTVVTIVHWMTAVCPSPSENKPNIYELVSIVFNSQQTADGVFPGVDDTSDFADVEQILEPVAQVEDIRNSIEFITAMKNATLDVEYLDADVLHRLRNPQQCALDIGDEDLRLSIELFLATNNASQDTYNRSRDAILCRHPDDKLLSYHQVKGQVAELSGVSWLLTHMCPNSCIAYSGPFATLESCPHCGEDRYDRLAFEASAGRVMRPRREFHTVPLGPQLQALWRSPIGARNMQHRAL